MKWSLLLNEYLTSWRPVIEDMWDWYAETEGWATSIRLKGMSTFVRFAGKLGVIGNLIFALRLTASSSREGSSSFIFITDTSSNFSSLFKAWRISCFSNICRSYVHSHIWIEVSLPVSAIGISYWYTTISEISFNNSLFSNSGCRFAIYGNLEYRLINSIIKLSNYFISVRLNSLSFFSILIVDCFQPLSAFNLNLFLRRVYYSSAIGQEHIRKTEYLDIWKFIIWYFERVNNIKI